MEDAFSALLPLLIIVLSIVTKFGKARKNQTSAKTDVPPRDAAPRPALARSPTDQAAPASAPARPAPAPVSAPVPAASPAPAPAQIGPEGEDACHEYMLHETQEETREMPQPPDSEAAARELVRGVIIGEILRRPSERRCGRRA